MLDITMCTNLNCLQAKDCFRHVAITDNPWQSFFKESPSLKGKNGECVYFLNKNDWPKGSIQKEYR